MNAISTKNKNGRVQAQPAKHWRVTSAALAVALLAGGWSFSAQALVLGQIRVNSALGEPLKAEIPVTQLTADEALSLQVRIAPPSDFSGRGLVYSSAISSMRVSFEKTGATTGILRLNSQQRPIQDPFMDVLMDLTWRTGSMQRSYTMLIDPPSTIAVAPAPILAPRNEPVVRNESPTAVAPRPVGNLPQAGADGVRREHISTQLLTGNGAQATPANPVRVAPTNSTATSQPPVRPQTSQPQRGSEDFSVRVARGQTLGQIAASMKPANVSTEQMLVALYNANPSAFINRNINWVRAGVTLRIPSESEIAAVSRAEARRTVSEHARNFNDHRRQTAQAATPVSRPDTITHATGGAVTARPANSGAAAQPDRVLQITSGEQAKPEDTQVAINTQRQEGAQRIDEIKTNQNELDSLRNSIGGNDSATSGSIVSTTNEPVATTPPPLVVEPQGGNNSVQAGVPTDVPAAVNNAPVEVTPPVEVAPPVNVPAEQANTPVRPPVVQPGDLATNSVPVPQKDFIDELLDEPLIPLGGLAVVLLAGFVGLRVLRRRKQEVDLIDEDPESVVDSFFADNISQQTTTDNMLDQSTSIYAASQLDTNADVDPVQEADVYLAYGRDEQAAEILRDALQAEPSRVALHAKLCEVYARQSKINEFNEQASQLRALTRGEGADWNRVAKLGETLAPSNPLFTAAVPQSGFAANFAPPAQTSTPFAAPAQQQASTSMNWDMAEPAKPTASAGAQSAQGSEGGYGFSDISLDLSNDGNRDSMFAPSGSLSTSIIADDDDEGPVTRLALAEEFLAIGNKNDAKEIVQEVLAESLSDDVKARATALLDQTK